MTDDNNKPNGKTQSIPSSVDPDAPPAKKLYTCRCGKVFEYTGQLPADEILDHFETQCPNK